MSFRTVIIKNRAKLDFSLNYLVYRGEETKKIHISEISTLIIESTAVSLTAALLAELVKNHVKVVLCDEKHLPLSQIVGFYDNYHSSKNILKQIAWEQADKELVWTNIVLNKINNQAKLLEKYDLSSELIRQYLSELEVGDITNREGHSAKVYFNSLFAEMSRRVPSFYNNALNYGYAILLSAFCREIVSCGLITQLGIWHCNEFNHYNLACDLMETFRIIVDDMVLQLDNDDKNFKSKMANVVNAKVLIGGKKVFLEQAIHIYTASVINKLSSRKGEILNYENYELPFYENNDNV